jgi:hypothetical protein
MGDRVVSEAKGGGGDMPMACLYQGGILRVPPETTAGVQGPCVNIKCETKGGGTLHM